MFGPPGTGKTTRLATDIIPNAIAKYGFDGVMVTSFTRTAAKEIASRGIDIDTNNVGTLHSLCFKALGAPQLHVKYLKDWNERHPQFALIGAKTGSVDEGGDAMSLAAGSDCEGDAIFSKIQILRSKMVPMERWPKDILPFHKLWEDWKQEKLCYDFTDLISVALKTIHTAPRRPQVMIVDEAQDFNALQIALVRSWGLNMRWHMLVGDDDQCIFSFSGASPETFLNPPLDDKYKTILGQSYRVPAAVHRKALEISSRIKVREKKDYKPKVDPDTGETVEGRVIYGDGSYKDVEWALQKAKEIVAEGKTVMFLSSCAYMIGEVISRLKARGIPFYNPYRTNRSDWNPLGSEDNDNITGSELLLSFLEHGEDENYWTVEQILKWGRNLSVGETGLIRGKAKKAMDVLEVAWAQNTHGLHTTRNVLAMILSPNAIEPALNRDIDWLMANVKKPRMKGLKYPLKIFKVHGLDALREKPKIIVGTIHSVKGGEAHSVFLYPDISYAAMREQEDSQEGADALSRLFYVGVTRAEDTLYIMEPSVSGNNGYHSAFVEI